MLTGNGTQYVGGRKSFGTVNDVVEHYVAGINKMLSERGNAPLQRGEQVVFEQPQRGTCVLTAYVRGCTVRFGCAVTERDQNGLKGLFEKNRFGPRGNARIVIS